VENRSLHEQPGAEDIVVHRLPWVPLHQGDVFVSGGMKNHRGPVLPEDHVKQPQILDLAEDRHGGDAFMFMAQFHLHIVQIFFAGIEKENQTGCEAENLPTQFGAD